MNKSNDILLHYLTRITVFFVFIFSIYLFFAGHNQPGGGFIGGLMTACTFLLLFLNFDREKIKKALPLLSLHLLRLGCSLHLEQELGACSLMVIRFSLTTLITLTYPF